MCFSCFLSAFAGDKLVLSVSDEALPVEFLLRSVPNGRDLETLQSFPRGVRPLRKAFGYAEKDRVAAYHRKGFFARLWINPITRLKVRRHAAADAIQLENFT